MFQLRSKRTNYVPYGLEGFRNRERQITRRFIIFILLALSCFFAFMLITINRTEGADFLVLPTPPPTSYKIRAMVELEAINAGLDVALVVRWIDVESSFNRRAESHAGAHGVCQMLIVTAREEGLQGDDATVILQLQYPPIAVPLCVRAIAKRLRTHDGNWDRALATWYAGRSTGAYIAKINRRGL